MKECWLLQGVVEKRVDERTSRFTDTSYQRNDLSSERHVRRSKSTTENCCAVNAARLDKIRDVRK